MPHQCTNCERTFPDGSTEMLSGCPDCGGTKFQFRPDGFDDGEESGQSTAGADEPSEPPEPPDRPGDSMTRTVGSAAATVRDIVGSGASPGGTDATPPETDAHASTETDSSIETDDDIIVAESDPTGAEDTAQADARSQIAGPDEVPGPGSDGFAPVAGDSATEGAETDDGTAGSDEESDTGETDHEGETSDEERAVAAEPDAERTNRPDLAELREELNEQFESIRVVEPGQYELNLMELYDREEYIVALQEDGRYSIQMPESWREADA